MDYKTAGPYAVKNWDVEVKICYYLLLSSALPGPSWRYSHCPLTLLKINFWLLLPCYCVTVLLCITSCPAGWLLYSVFTSSLNASLDPLRSVAPTRWRESTEMFTGICGSNWCNWWCGGGWWRSRWFTVCGTLLLCYSVRGWQQTEDSAGWSSAYTSHSHQSTDTTNTSLEFHTETHGSHSGTQNVVMNGAGNRRGASSH